jgi:hypothetical protein
VLRHRRNPLVAALAPVAGTTTGSIGDCNSHPWPLSPLTQTNSTC